MNNQRFVLMGVNPIGTLRQELISGLGMDRAKGFMLRFGWKSGMEYARLIKSVMPKDTPLKDMMRMGLPVSGMAGQVQVEIKKFICDQENGNYYTEG